MVYKDWWSTPVVSDQEDEETFRNGYFDCQMLDYVQPKSFLFIMSYLTQIQQEITILRASVM